MTSKIEFKGGIEMPAVRRFRPLGKVQPVRREICEKTITQTRLTQTTESKEQKNEIKRFQPLSDPERRIRNDRKHRYPLRVENGLWQRVWELSLNCGGSASGASLNVILTKLILHALDDEGIVKRIEDEFPNKRDEFIKIRSWRLD